jgi:CheY-like chemotaxis protein
MTTILIIDDEPQVRLLLKYALEDAGYKVLEAPDGKEGVRVYRNNPADLIITDIIMPEKEGLETIKDLRQDNPDLKVIAISGGGRNNPDGYLEAAKLFGAQYAFSKPVELQELLNAVKSLLEN